MLRKYKHWFLSVLCGLLLVFSFPNLNIWIFSWFAFVPLFSAIKRKSKAKAFFLAYSCGIIFWIATIYWLAHVTILGMIILVVYLSLYFGIFGLFIRSYQLPVTSYQLLIIPSSWCLLEYLRTHLLSGFPWALLGYSQYLNLPVIQIADITGIWGVSFLVMLVNISIWVAIEKKSLWIKQALAVSLCLLVILSYGIYSINQTGKPVIGKQARVKVTVVQGNIPQELKWDALARQFIINKYSGITLEAAKNTPDLLIWPEASLPVVAEEDPAYYERAADLAKKIQVPLLLGSVTLRDNNYYNSALLISKQGNLTERYDKLHLVPFGEYIPARKVFPFLQAIAPIGDITAGREYIIFKSPVNFSVLICFEDLFPELSRNFVKKGALFLVNITNDAWYKYSPAPYQHLQASVFRAVENRVFLARSANTGVSGFVSPSGEVMSVVKDAGGRDIFVDGYDTQEFSVTGKPLTFYTRFGDLFIVICVFLLVCGIITNLKVAARGGKS